MTDFKRPLSTGAFCCRNTIYFLHLYPLVNILYPITINPIITTISQNLFGIKKLTIIPIATQNNAKPVTRFILPYIYFFINIYIKRTVNIHLRFIKSHITVLLAHSFIHCFFYIRVFVIFFLNFSIISGTISMILLTVS